MPILYLRLVGVIAAALVFALLWVTVSGWRDDSRALADSEARYAALERQTAETIATMQRHQEAAYRASEGYQNELQSLRGRPDRTRTVRVCNDPAAGRVPAAGPAAGGPHGPGETARLVPADVGQSVRDVDVTDLLLEADRCSAQLRALQAWTRAVQ
jgi:hypothetical protein